MEKNQIIKVAGQIFDKVKVGFIFLAALFIPVVYYSHLYEYKGILVWYATAWLFLFLLIIFDIHKQVREKPNHRIILESGWKVFPKLLELMKGPKRDRQNIKIIALTLASVWPQIRDILRDNNYRNIDIKLLQLDPDLTDLDSIHLGWRKEVTQIHEHIENYLNSNKDDLEKRNITIEVKRYKHGPCIHGYLVNDKNLFFSLCKWETKSGGRIELEGHPNFYEHFDNREDEKQRPYFELFDNWFNHFFCDKEEKEVKSP
jgi:hypothetical protein